MRVKCGRIGRLAEVRFFWACGLPESDPVDQPDHGRDSP